jgi:ABC-type transport system involved in multi-copper enzyme maturation permease subunit
MRRISFETGLPLLARELSEQAARRRTYILRVGYACLIFGIFAVVYASTGQFSTAAAIRSLGTGGRLFEAIVGLQFFGIYLFMPAIVCGVISYEKERSTLELLLLTRLDSGTIILEKFFSRLIPMLNLVLLSLPILGFAYTLGGMSAKELPLAAWVALLTMLHTGSLALLCSAWFRTTFGAFVAVYLVLIVGFAVCMGAVSGQPVNRSWPLMVMYLPVVYEQLRNASLPVIAMASLPMFLSTLVSLAIASECLRRRAALAGGNPLLRWFHQLDRIIKALNDEYCRGRVVFHEDDSLPETDPVAWRETQKTPLGAPRFLIRVLLGLEVPVVAYCVMALPAAFSGRLDPMVVALVCVWAIAVLLVAVKGASLVSAERSRQTLDVLLTTPMAGRDFLLQKFRGLDRLIWVMRVPLLTILVCELLATIGTTHPADGIMLQLTMLAFDLPMIGWLGCWIGLRASSQRQAILTTLGVLCAWTIGAMLFGGWFWPPGILVALSPAKVVLGDPRYEADLVVVSCLASVGFWQLFRWRCLQAVNERLGRLNELAPAPSTDATSTQAVLRGEAF